MKLTISRQPLRNAGMTLLEVLAVIAIIAILISILVPAIARSKIKAKVGMAKVDCATISTAIKSYYNDYGRYPVRKGQKANTPGGDLSYDVSPPNSDAVVTLIDDTELNDVNKNHRANYKKTRYFEPKLTDNLEEQGIGPDGVFRDPFGNPYVISVDLNNDDKCCDVLYGLPSISDISGDRIGQFGLMRETINDKEMFCLPSTVMVWSAGPDRDTSLNDNAKQGANYDNIIGWPH